MEFNSIIKDAGLIRNWLIEIRRDFHKNPELGMQEFRTKEKIIGYLKNMDIEIITDIAETAVVGIIRGSKKGKTVALRADMDALPIKDMKNKEYKSLTEGIIHGCGHDAHMTILLGAAKILKKMESNLNGTVKLFFQPAEETVGGAKPMIDAGVMENPKVDGIFGLHVTPEIDTGMIGLKYGQMNASSDTIKIIIKGKSTHGAYPQDGIDSIVVAAQVINALQSIVSRNVDPRKSAVISIGKISGGTQGNIIADKVEMVGTIRTLDPQTREDVIKRAEETVKLVSMGLGATGEFYREEGYPALINNDIMVDLVKSSAEKLLGDKNILILDNPSLGVEDFAYFSQNTKGAFYRLGCRNEKKGIINPAHNGLFDIDEDCLEIGTAIQVMNVLTFLEGDYLNE